MERLHRGHLIEIGELQGQLDATGVELAEGVVLELIATDRQLDLAVDGAALEDGAILILGQIAFYYMAALYGVEQLGRKLAEWMFDPDAMVRDMATALLKVLDNFMLLKEYYTEMVKRERAVMTFAALLPHLLDRVAHEVEGIVTAATLRVERCEEEAERLRTKLKIALSLLDRMRLAKYVQICFLRGLDTSEVEEIIRQRHMGSEGESSLERLMKLSEQLK